MARACHLKKHMVGRNEKYKIQILLYGEQLSNADVTLTGKGVILKEVVKRENPNYLLLLYLDLTEADAQTLPFVLNKERN